jgi:hypothetical protein
LISTLLGLHDLLSRNVECSNVVTSRLAENIPGVVFVTLVARMDSE